jgi:hypothetical protein
MAFSRISKVVGLKGVYLSFFKSLGTDPFPITVPIFGRIRTYHEILNMHYNFAVGELRDERVETYLKNEKSPW